MQTSNQINGKGTILTRRVQAWGLVVGVILLIPLSYGFVYYQERENYITSLYFRSLSEIDHQLNRGLRGLDYLLDYALHESNPAFHNFCSNKYKEYCEEYKDYFAKYSNDLRNIEFGEWKADECVEVKTSNKGSSDKTRFEVSGAPDNRKITVFEFAKKSLEKEEKDGNSNDPCRSKKDVVNKDVEVHPEGIWREATVRLSDLIEPSPALKYFDEILLLDKSGHILYRSGADDVSKTGNFDALDDFARFENLIDYLQTDEEHQWDHSTKKASSERVNLPVSHSTVRDAEIGSISYILFIQPFHAVREQYVDSKDDDPSTKKGKLAYLVGIVSEKKYIADIVSLPIGRITIVLAGVLFIILLIPHLKLELSGQHFMPSRTLAASLAVSLPLLVVLLTTGFFGARDYLRLSRGLNDTASAIATRIKENFDLEFGGFRGTAVCTDKEFDRVVDDKNKIYDVIEAMMAEASQKEYPKYELGFFLDKHAQQIGMQFGYRSFPAAPIKVPRREYFKRPYYRPESLMAWPSKNGTGPKPQPYYSERIQTYDQGMKLTAYSRPTSTDNDSKCLKGINKDKVEVEVLIKLMHTFFKPVLPMGFGFAVIEDLNGDVIYHSNDQRSLLENFFVETDQNDSLIAAAQSRHDQEIDGMYNGDPHGFFVSPLANTSWSLIVYYDKSLMEVAHLKGWLYANVLATSIVVILLIIFYFFYPLISKRLEHFAPHGQFWISTRARFPFIKNYFDCYYVIVAAVLLVLIFGLATRQIYECQFNKQMEQLSKLNLVHVGKQLLDRKTSLIHEAGRLVKKEVNHGIALEKVTYLKEDLSKFAIYSAVDPSLDTHRDDNNGSDQDRETQKLAWAVSNKTKNECVHGNEDSPSSRSDFAQFIQETLPPLSRLDAAHRVMTHNKASDDSWYFGDQKLSNTLSAELQDPGDQERIVLTGWSDPSAITALRPFQNFLLSMYALLAFSLLFNLIKFTSQRLMGLRFPPRGKWREYFYLYQPDAILELAPGLPAGKIDPYHAHLVDKRSDIAEKNFKTIVSGASEPLLEMKSILFNRSGKSLINFDNTEPLMWLILGGLFQYNHRGIDFESREMKKWVREQNWSKQIHDYEAASRTNLWRLLAPAFYAILLLAIGYLVLSGGHIGELIVSLLPVALAGGFPLVSQLFEKFVRE